MPAAAKSFISLFAAFVSVTCLRSYLLLQRIFLGRGRALFIKRCLMRERAALYIKSAQIKNPEF